MNPEEREEHRRGQDWFRRLSPSEQWELGDHLVLGMFDWREWFDRKPSRAFMNGVEYARILMEA